MKIYDISQMLFSAKVYPGDPCPQKEPIMRIAEGNTCNLTSIKLCCHNGTHVDAPFHFIERGRTVGEIPLEKCIGPCRVIDWDCPGAEDRLTTRLADGTRKILLKGSFELTLELTGKIADAGIDLLGVENCTVGNKETGPFVHKRLLEREIAILEGLVLRHVPEGDYLLAAQPLNLGDLDGAPCRAVLLEVPV